MTFIQKLLQGFVWGRLRQYGQYIIFIKARLQDWLGLTYKIESEKVLLDPIFIFTLNAFFTDFGSYLKVLAPQLEALVT